MTDHRAFESKLAPTFVAMVNLIVHRSRLWFVDIVIVANQRIVVKELFVALLTLVKLCFILVQEPFVSYILDICNFFFEIWYILVDSFQVADEVESFDRCFITKWAFNNIWRGFFLFSFS